MNGWGFTTRAVHVTGPKTDGHHALRFPVYEGVVFGFESAEAMAEAFSGRRAAHAYTRISNPTVEAFERKITSLEGGFATVAVSSGMAAITVSLLSLLASGDNIVAASELFGGTKTLFETVFAHLGIETRFVPADNPAAIASAIDERSRVLFLETISNPGLVVPDFIEIACRTRDRGIAVVADSTVTSPYLFRARDYGVNIVIHSTTKYISGGATSMGGVVVDLGNFDWTRIPALARFHRFREGAMVARLRKEVYEGTGSCMAPHSAYLQNLGVETLPLRLERICQNAEAIARFLQEEPSVKTVLYPGLPSSRFHELAKRQFNRRFGGVLSFKLADRAACFRFLNRLSLISRATNLGDNKTLAIHPASTIFTNFTEDRLEEAGVTDDLIRLAVGIEDIEDIIADLRKASKKVNTIMNEEQIERYSRNIILKEVGGKGQERLLTSKVLIIGVGGLGAPAALYLAAAGVGTLGLVDGDNVDLSNLQRQVIHFTDDVGKPKVESAREKIRRLNPDVQVNTYRERVWASNIREIISGYDFIIDGTDNFPAKFLINDACVLSGKPFSHAGILRFDGQTITVKPGGSPCYRCIFIAPPPPGTVPSCSEAGILGGMAGIIGTIQAVEALKFLLGVEDPLYGRLLILDARSMRFRDVKVRRNADCPVCGEHPVITNLIDYEQKACGIKR